MKPKIEIGDNLAFVLIILIVLLACLLGGYLDSKAQTVTLPAWVADSLIFETKLSRQCSQVMTAQTEEIKALGLELVANNKALQLSQSQSRTLEGLLTNSKENNQILTKQFALDLRREKRKSRKRGAVILGETIAIIGLILLL